MEPLWNSSLEPLLEPLLEPSVEPLWTPPRRPSPQRVCGVLGPRPAPRAGKCWRETDGGALAAELGRHAGARGRAPHGGRRREPGRAHQPVALNCTGTGAAATVAPVHTSKPVWLTNSQPVKAEPRHRFIFWFAVAQLTPGIVPEYAEDGVSDAVQALPGPTLR